MEKLKFFEIENLQSIVGGKSIVEDDIIFVDYIIIEDDVVL